jgi:hypothetical protein
MARRDVRRPQPHTASQPRTRLRPVAKHSLLDGAHRSRQRVTHGPDVGAVVQAEAQRRRVLRGLRHADSRARRASKHAVGGLASRPSLHQRVTCPAQHTARATRPRSQRARAGGQRPARSRAPKLRRKPRGAWSLVCCRCRDAQCQHGSPAAARALEGEVENCVRYNARESARCRKASPSPLSLLPSSGRSQ